eukprot:scaffold2808_cov255-Pinguiococcus_pyrenoidosus.AAC.46
MPGKVGFRTCSSGSNPRQRRWNRALQLRGAVNGVCAVAGVAATSDAVGAKLDSAQRRPMIGRGSLWSAKAPRKALSTASAAKFSVSTTLRSSCPCATRIVCSGFLMCRREALCTANHLKDN